MLAANEAVARELGRRKLAFLQSRARAATPESVQELARFLEGLGLRLARSEGAPTPAAFADVLRRAAGRREERSSTRCSSARCSSTLCPEPSHFGLATDCYTHFSPRSGVIPIWSSTGSSRRARPPTRRDRRGILPARAIAMEAEREIIQLKKIQFKHDKCGETYAGFVSGVVPFGLFVSSRTCSSKGSCT